MRKSNKILPTKPANREKPLPVAMMVDGHKAIAELDGHETLAKLGTGASGQNKDNLINKDSDSSQSKTPISALPSSSGRITSDPLSSFQSSVNRGEYIDPIKFKDLLWPHINFYKEQEDVVYSVADNEETYVVACNMSGKDFVTAFICIWFFLSRNPCRILTTSVDQPQLEGVLWGEIRRWVDEAVYPLDSKDGGPLVMNHLHIRKMIDGKLNGLSYIRGRVAARGEGMLGHHIADVGDGIPRTLAAFDEASGISDIAYERCTTWARRVLVIGNAWTCNNFFYKGVKSGDIVASNTCTV